MKWRVNNSVVPHKPDGATYSSVKMVHKIETETYTELYRLRGALKPPKRL